MNRRMTKSIRHFIYRLIEMFLMYIIPAFLFYVLLRTPFMAASNFISDIFFQEEPIGVNLTILFLLCLLMIFIMAHAGIISFHKRRERVNLIKYWLLHPPAWLYAWIFVILIQLSPVQIFLVKYKIIAFTNIPNYQQSLINILILVSPIIAFILWSQIVRNVGRNKKLSNAYRPIGNIFDDTASLEKWLRYEEPITNPEQDVCNHKIISGRIARIILEAGDERLPKIGLVGPYGSGKSSILNLVSHYLYNPEEVNARFNGRAKEFIICSVSTWGQHDNCNASEFILKQVIKTVEREFNCLEIRGLPKDYQLAISANWFEYGKFISTLFSLQPSPEDTLKKLDYLLYQIGRKIVIYLEDCDRNYNQSQFFLEMSTLLDRIGNLDNVTFAFAVGEMKDVNEILTKIADHEEIIPKMSQENSKRIFSNFFSLCRVDFPDNSLFSPNRYDADERTLSFSIIVKKLIPYPRHLKKVLWDTFYSWNMLRNEIDFEDLFLVNLLKATEPKAYAFIGDYIGQLRNGFSSLYHSVYKIEDKRFENIIRAWKDSTGEELEINNQPPDRKYFIHTSPIWKIIEYLFPELRTSSLCSRQGLLNGISCGYPTDYWTRLHARELAPEEITDCETKKIVYEIMQRKYDNIIVKLTENRNWADKIFQFRGDLFKDQIEIQEIVGKIIEQTIHEGKICLDKGSSSFIENCYGVMKKIESLDYDEYKNWMLAIIQETMKYNMSWSNEFYFHWINIYPPGANLIDVANKRLSIIENIFLNNPYTLINSLKNAGSNMFPCSNLMRLVLFPMGVIEWTDFNYSEWSFLIPPIMQAAEIEKEVFIPQIAELIFKIGIIREPDIVITVNLRKEAEEIFGDMFIDALKLVAEYVFVNEDDVLCNAYAKCQEEAQIHLERI